MQAALKAAGPAIKPVAPTRRVAMAGVTGRPQPETAEPRGPKESRIGKAPITVPAAATITLEDAYIKVKVTEEARGWWVGGEMGCGRKPEGGRRRLAISWPRRRSAGPPFPLRAHALPPHPTLPHTLSSHRARKASWS
jgi:hypothetical protein